MDPLICGHFPRGFRAEQVSETCVRGVLPSGEQEGP